MVPCWELPNVHRLSAKGPDIALSDSGPLAECDGSPIAIPHDGSIVLLYNYGNMDPINIPPLC